jgi:hypothetical protein
MTSERLIFSEESIPEVVAVVRAGLRARLATADWDVAKSLGQQCDELEAYWNGSGESNIVEVQES